MKRKPTWLLDFKRDIHSQTGEDGILEKVLKTIGANDRWCVEFGAWDGMYLTNTRHLIESRGYAAVLIEADTAKYQDLRKNYAPRPTVVTMNRFVGFKADDNLDVILGETRIPKNFDLLSIDIDGNDYHVWQAMNRYKPKVVIVEFNPTIPTEVDFVQPADPAINHGSSLSALVALGKKKGYELVCVLPFNAVFVRREFYPRFGLESNDPAALRTDLSAVTWMFSGYDGTIMLRGACRLPWHTLELREKQMQRLPRRLRSYPNDYSRWQRIQFAFFLPGGPLGRLWERVSARLRRKR